MNYKAEYLRWLNNENVDEATKSELKAIENDEEQIKFRFSRFLEFGTGGLRGTMIAGTNAMNVYTVAKATQGFASYIIKEGAAARGVVITNDSRNNSRAFAEITAEVFAANGIRAYLFESLRPTPVLSFAIRHLGCVAGVNITASHNPKEYNGYKAYWDDGAQLSLEQADEVSAYINATDIFDGVKRMPLEGAISCGMVKIVGEDVDNVYLENVIAQRVDTEIIPKMADQLRIVYTPLHGCGHKLVPEALSLCGVKHLYTVSEQMVLDGQVEKITVKNKETAYVYLHKGVAERYREDESQKQYRRMPVSGPQLLFNIGSVELLRQDLDAAEEQSGHKVILAYEKDEGGWIDVLISVLPWLAAGI